MKNYITNFCTVITLLVVTVSCSPEETFADLQEFDGTTEELIRLGLSDASLFYDAAVEAGLSDFFEGNTEYTIFAPSNTATQAWLEDSGYTSISEVDATELATFVQSYIVAGTMTSSSLTKSALTDLNGNVLHISIKDGVVLNASATVVDADNLAENGVIHIIDYPLLDTPSQTVMAYLTAQSVATAPEFTILVEALSLTGLDVDLENSTEYTVFAPTDAAFGDIGLAVGDLAGIPVVDLTEMINFHVLSDRNFTIDLSDGRAYTIAGASGTARGIDIDAASDAITIGTGATGESETSSVNILNTNGTIHVMDAVVFPKPYLIDAIDGSWGYFFSGQNIDQFITPPFHAAMLGAEFDFTTLLSTEVEYTILLPEGFNDGLTEPANSEMLKTHVFEGTLSYSGMVGSRIESINGAGYFVTEASDGWISINGGGNWIQSFMSGTPYYDLTSAYNGTFTAVYSQLVPLPGASVYTVIDEDVEADTLSLFNAALKYYELDSLPNTTYLYVENSDFADVYDDAGIDPDPLQLEDADEDVMVAALNSYLFSTVYFSNGLEAGDSWTSRGGGIVDWILTTEGDVGIDNSDGGVIAIIEVTNFDVLGSHGVIHVINGLLP